MENNFQFLIYRSAEEDVSINAVVKDESIWLTQKGMAKLFGVQPAAINKHLANIYEEGELQTEATISKMETVEQEGFRMVSRERMFYNLDAIISVGYRVNSRRATQFRIWATGILKEYMSKGFVLDDERLKQGKDAFGKDYFRELLERVRSIRASERRIWQQVTDIFAECSIDYDRNSPVTKDFYAMVQKRDTDRHLWRSGKSRIRGKWFGFGLLYCTKNQYTLCAGFSFCAREHTSNNTIYYIKESAMNSENSSRFSLMRVVGVEQQKMIE